MSDDWARPVVHWEIVAQQPERMAAFYGHLFNWDIGDGPIMTIPAGHGGPEPVPVATSVTATTRASTCSSRFVTSAHR
jgi:hypothetical protein